VSTVTLLLDDPKNPTIFGDSFYVSNHPCFSINVWPTSIVMSRALHFCEKLTNPRQSRLPLNLL